MDRAEQMREAAIEACRYDDAHDCKEAIRALPLPPQPPLADAVKMLADAIDRMTDAEYLDAACELDKALQTHDRGKAAAALRRIAEGEA